MRTRIVQRELIIENEEWRIDDLSECGSTTRNCTLLIANCTLFMLRISLWRADNIRPYECSRISLNRATDCRPYVTLRVSLLRGAEVVAPYKQQ